MGTHFYLEYLEPSSLNDLQLEKHRGRGAEGVADRRFQIAGFIHAQSGTTMPPGNGYKIDAGKIRTIDLLATGISELGREFLKSGVAPIIQDDKRDW